MCVGALEGVPTPAVAVVLNLLLLSASALAAVRVHEHPHLFLRHSCKASVLENDQCNVVITLLSKLLMRVVVSPWSHGANGTAKNGLCAAPPILDSLHPVPTLISEDSPRLGVWGAWPLPVLNSTSLVH